MIGTPLVIPLSIIVTRFMLVPFADARYACLVASIMDGSNIRIAHNHGIVTNTGDMLVLASGNYTVAHLIAIMAGAMWRENIDDRAFCEFASAMTEYEAIYHIRDHARDRVIVFEQE
jgi:hypothetical protein